MKYLSAYNNRGDAPRLVAETTNQQINEIKALKAVQAATTRTVEQVIFTPIATPASPVEGQTYMDSTSHKLRTYDGTTWQDHW